MGGGGESSLEHDLWPLSANEKEVVSSFLPDEQSPKIGETNESG